MKRCRVPRSNIEGSNEMSSAKTAEKERLSGRGMERKAREREMEGEINVKKKSKQVSFKLVQ